MEATATTGHPLTRFAMSYWAQVVGGTVLHFLFGALWYGPINGALFLQLAFRNAQPPSDLNFPLCHAVTITACFGLNNLLKLVVDAMDVYTVTGGIVMGSAMWAFGLFLQLPHAFYEHRSLVLTLVHEIGHLIALLSLATYYALLSDAKTVMDHLQVGNVVRKLCPTIDVSESSLTKSGGLLRDVLRRVIKNARVLARHAKRASITQDDINQSLTILGHEPVYGSLRFKEQRLVPLEGKGVFFAEDIDVSVAEVNNVVLECPPADIQIHSHWLAIEGVQPHVPENEPIAVERQRRNEPKRSTKLSKETLPNKKRKNHAETVQPVTGGMVQGGVELRLPVEHALTAEQQAYFEQIRHHVEKTSTSASDDGASAEQAEKRIENLSHDAALQPLVPYLIRFAARQIYGSIQNVQALRFTLRILHSLVRNKHIDLELYSHHILPLILSCLLSESIGEASTQHRLGEVCKLRDDAATVLACAVDTFDDSVSNVQCRISQKLADCLEPDAAFIVKYGAIRGLDALGMTKVEAVVKLLQLCLNHIEEKLAETSSSSLIYHQGKACGALIEEILDRPRQEKSEEPSPFQSPLQKKAKLDDTFL